MIRKIAICLGAAAMPATANAQEVLAWFDTLGECRRVEASAFNEMWKVDKDRDGAGADRGRSFEMNPFVCRQVRGRWALVYR